MQRSETGYIFRSKLVFTARERNVATERRRALPHKPAKRADVATPMGEWKCPGTYYAMEMEYGGKIEQLSLSTIATEPQSTSLMNARTLFAMKVLLLQTIIIITITVIIIQLRLYAVHEIEMRAIATNVPWPVSVYG